MSASTADLLGAVKALQAKVGEHDDSIRRVMESLGLPGRVEAEPRSAPGLRDDEKI